MFLFFKFKEHCPMQIILAYFSDLSKVIEPILIYLDHKAAIALLQFHHAFLLQMSQGFNPQN